MDPTSAGPAMSDGEAFRTLLPPHTKCLYKPNNDYSRALLAVIESFNESDSTYNLDVKPHSQPNRILPFDRIWSAEAWPRGTPVWYYSEAAANWLPARIASFNDSDGTYNLAQDANGNLDLRQHAQCEFIRLRVDQRSVAPAGPPEVEEGKIRKEAEAEAKEKEEEEEGKRKEAEAEEELEEERKRNKNIPATVLGGNPGKGKSTLANSRAGEVLFEAGPTSGAGLTMVAREAKSSKEERFIDPPGLADACMEQRVAAAKEWTNLLQKGGDYKFVFVVTELQSRIQDEDKTTIAMILGAAPEIGNNYGIVVNQCGPWMMKKSRDAAWRSEFEQFLLQKLPFHADCICYNEFNEELDHGHNKIASLSPEVHQFFDNLPVVTLRPSAARKVVPESFFEITQKLRVSQDEYVRFRQKIAELEMNAKEFMEPPAVSRRLGIQLRWVLQDFPHSPQFAGMEPLLKDFVELSKKVAYGDDAFGKGKYCPRDGRADCSIVDAVQCDGYSAEASDFLSWVWKTPLKTVLSALNRWKNSRVGFQDEIVFLWWCFFQNNQFRILGDRQSQSTEVLASIFGGQLKQIGRMISLLDRVEDSGYMKRVWCGFELFVASLNNIRIEIILPETAAAELDSLCRLGLRRIRRAAIIDIANAKATAPEDEEGIKRLICEKSSFEEVNRKATEALAVGLCQLLIETDAAEATPQDVTVGSDDRPRKCCYLCPYLRRNDAVMPEPVMGRSSSTDM